MLRGLLFEGVLAKARIELLADEDHVLVPCCLKHGIYIL